jgi:rhodanese-related sulfurtransferase
MARKASSVIDQLQIFEEEIDRLENSLLALEQRMLRLHEIQRAQLIRVKNHEEISDEFILQNKGYQDLSPERAWKLYQNPDFNFILIDVSAADYRPPHQIPEAIRMPWEEFAHHSLTLQSRSTPIFVISEDGTKSVLACEFLVKRGFYNCNNVSGGYQHWKGGRLREIA